MLQVHNNFGYQEKVILLLLNQVGTFESNLRVMYRFMQTTLYSLKILN